MKYKELNEVQTFSFLQLKVEAVKPFASQGRKHGF